MGDLTAAAQGHGTPWGAPQYASITFFAKLSFKKAGGGGEQTLTAACITDVSGLGVNL